MFFLEILSKKTQLEDGFALWSTTLNGIVSYPIDICAPLGYQHKKL